VCIAKKVQSFAAVARVWYVFRQEGKAALQANGREGQNAEAPSMPSRRVRRGAACYVTQSTAREGRQAFAGMVIAGEEFQSPTRADGTQRVPPQNFTETSSHLPSDTDRLLQERWQRYRAKAQAANVWAVLLRGIVLLYIMQSSMHCLTSRSPSNVFSDQKGIGSGNTRMSRR